MRGLGEIVAFVLADGSVRPAMITRAYWVKETETEGAPLVRVVTGNRVTQPSRIAVNLRVFYDDSAEAHWIIGNQGPWAGRVVDSPYAKPEIGVALKPGTWHELEETPSRFEALREDAEPEDLHKGDSAKAAAPDEMVHGTTLRAEPPVVHVHIHGTIIGGGKVLPTVALSVEHQGYVPT
jgi:hypothetical protein